jgi:hypothetical protein
MTEPLEIEAPETKIRLQLNKHNNGSAPMLAQREEEPTRPLQRDLQSLRNAWRQHLAQHDTSGRALAYHC